MAVISIRPATEKLGNIGEIRRPDRIPHFVSPKAHTVNKRPYIEAIGKLGGAIERVGEMGMRFAMIAKEEKEKIALAEAGADYQQRLRDGFMNAETGLMTRTGDAIENLDRDTDEFMKTTLDQVCEDRNLSGRMKELFRAHVNPVTQSWQGHMANHILSETVKLKRGAATANREATYETWMQSQFDPQLTAKLISDYEHERSEYGDAEEVRNANVRKFSQGLAADMVLGSIRSCLTEADFDERINRLKTDPDSFYRDNEALYAELGAGALSPKTVEGLIEQAKQKKDKSVLEQTRQLGAEVDALISKGGEAEAKGLVEQMDKQIAALKSKGEVLPDGSKVRLAAFQAAAKLEKSADSLAGQQMLTDYLDRLKDDPDYRLYIAEERGADGKVTKAAEYAYPKDSRKGKLCEQVQALVDSQRQASTAASHKSNVAYYELRMLNGAINPSQYHEDIFAAAKRGDLTLDEYVKLKSKFDASWAKGFTVGEKSPKQTIAEGMLGVINEFFPDETLAKSFSYSEKSGQMERTKDAAYKGLDYEVRDKGGFWRSLGDLYEWPSTSTTHTLSDDQVQKLVNVATDLSFFDGEVLKWDPITGQTDKDFFGNKIDGKTPFNAANYFRQYVQRLKDETKTEDAAAYVARLVEAESNMRNSAADRDERNTTELRQSQNGRPHVKPVRSSKLPVGTVRTK